jgi:hypothetical protein
MDLDATRANSKLMGLFAGFFGNEISINSHFSKKSGLCRLAHGVLHRGKWLLQLGAAFRQGGNQFLQGFWKFPHFGRSSL